MFPLLLKGISICEMNMLKVLSLTCDGAFRNRKLLKMYFHMTLKNEMNPDIDVT